MLLSVRFMAVAFVVLAVGDAKAGDQAPGKGALLFGGGELRFDNKAVWGRFVELTRKKPGNKPRIVVIPAASASPENAGQFVVEHLRSFGADAELLPIAVKHKTIKVQDAVKDKDILRKIREAGGIWFLGGAQRRITTALLEKDGSHTPALEAIWEAHRNGAVVGGSSAGAAVMSRMMFPTP